MEYARLTDGKVTVIVIDQDNAEYSAWPFAIKVKVPGSRFEHFNSRINLRVALEEATKEFMRNTHLKVQSGSFD
jgi:CO dehydrogenase/acetyl-CoA synthase beta subunit